MDDAMMPDLSHLSAEEREIIESVLRRQKEEEVREVQASQKADEELDQIEKQINDRKESARRLVGTQDDAICQICQKTKFADGIGHKCFYCQLRSCARCGGRSQSKNKAIWACSLCQKRQQILAKTGKWFQPDEIPPKMSSTNSGSPCQSQSPVPSTSVPVPQIITPTTSNQQIGPPVQAMNQPQRINEPIKQGNGQAGGAPMPNRQPAPMQQPRPQMGNQPIMENQRKTSNRQPTLEKDHSQANGSLQREDQLNRNRNSFDNPEYRDRKQTLGSKLTLSQDRRPSEQPPNFYTQNEADPRRASISTFPDRPAEARQQDRREERSGRKSSNEGRTSPVRNGPFSRENRENEEALVHRTATRQNSSTSNQPEFRRTRSIREEDSRRGSIGVQLKGDVQPVPVAPVTSTNHRPKKSRLHRQIRSMSSSDEEVQASTSEGFQGEEARQRIPNECTSEKDLLRYIYGSEKTKPNSRKSAISGYSSDSRELKMPNSTSVPSVLPGNMLAAKIRTYLSHPVTWQPSADQRRMIGHMILHRIDSSTNGDLGMKVVGGRRSDTGRLGAFVTRVKPGSVADTIGRLRSGDEVLEWNGQPLQNATYDQVYEIITASRHESQIELIVSRSASVPGNDDFLNIQTVQRQLPNPQLFNEFGSRSASPAINAYALTHSQSVILPQNISPMHRTVPYLQQDNSQIHGKGHIFGRIEISLYFSHSERQLVVTVERAFDLPPRSNGSLRNPYVKLFLIPDRSEKSRRQSGVLADTVSPIWSEVFTYQGLTEPILMDRALEVTVWDYDKYETNSFLGETLIDFSTVPLDGQPLLYTLVDMDDENPLRIRLKQRKLSNYSNVPQRPRSEMGYGQSANRHGYPMNGPDMYEDYGRYDNQNQMRRSRTYDRGGAGHDRYMNQPPVPPHAHPRIEEDWTQNASAGYLSDHGYSHLSNHNSSRPYRQRRPRSATAMRHLTAAEMSASRMYSRNMNEEREWEDTGTPERYMRGPYMPPADPRSPNGRILMETLQDQPDGSDGSETLSIHSAHSMPMVRTINRRGIQTNGGGDLSEPALDDFVMEEEGRGRMQKQTSSQSAQQAAKERKKSLMNRIIPGRAGQEQKRTGFARSEEVGIPENLSTDRLQSSAFMKQASKESNDSADNWLPVLPEGPLGSFVDDLGPGQVVGRQVLASPVLGKIQISLMASKNSIEVEIIKAEHLVVKQGTKITPAPYVKVYLMEGKTCIAKAKTNTVKRTTSPIFQQQLLFPDHHPKRRMLQISVLGDYGRMDKKSFMGIAQIRLDDLQLGSTPITGWYKLFHSSSLAGTGPVRKDSETSLTGAPTQ